jgi:ubiquinone/menaquinone biosynthesis C-methylase UbiE
MATTLAASVNHWPESKCARAFWGQHEAPAYRRLLADTSAWLDPRPGERWLDLGCGCGQLTRVLWEKSGGAVAEVVGLDCAAENARAFQKLRAEVAPPPTDAQLRFCCADFSQGLESWANAQFNGVVSGLAIQYAEAFSPERGSWTTDAYDHLLAEVFRVLRGGGWFVFSVNVPEPAWWKVALQSLTAIVTTPRRARFLKRAWRMMRYGAWLTQEARRGRFHYLPLHTIVDKLTAIGFQAIEHRLSYAGQAYLIRCRKPC